MPTHADTACRPLPTVLTMRQATLDDLPFLIALRQTTMREHVVRALGVYDESAQLARVQDRFDCAQILEVEDEPMGLFKLDRRPSPWVLAQIQIAPAFQRQGLGRALLRQTLADAALACQDVTLHVLEGNRARYLYEKMGFRETGRNATGALLLWRHLAL